MPDADRSTGTAAAADRTADGPRRERDDTGMPAASDRTSRGSDDEGDGLVPPIDPPGVQGQSELPGTRIDPRTFSLGVLAVLAVAYTLYFAQSILFPVTFALILTLLFRPVVRRLRRLRIPDSVSAAGVISLVLAVIGFGVYELAAPAAEFVRSVPDQLEQADEKVRTLAAPFLRINAALETGERIASGEVVAETASGGGEGGQESEAAADGAAEPQKGAADPTLEGRPVRAPSGRAETADRDGDGDPDEIVVRTNQQPTISDWVLSATGTFLAGSVICLVLLYFLLAAGDDMINNVLHVLPNFREKRGVVELIYAAEQGMSSYLLTVTVINVCLGVAEAGAMALLGVPNPLLWGAMACLFNFVPYVGAIAGTGIVALVSFVAFDSVAYALLPPAVYWALTALEGNFVTPTVLGKRISLNPVMVFLALAFWGWIWGVGGALIAVPLLAMTKIVCDQFKPLQPLGQLLER